MAVIWVEQHSPRRDHKDACKIHALARMNGLSVEQAQQNFVFWHGRMAPIEKTFADKHCICGLCCDSYFQRKVSK